MKETVSAETSKTKKPNYWSTHNELNFINSISSKTVLLKYREALLKREYWGSIDRNAVIDTIDNMLK